MHSEILKPVAVLIAWSLVMLVWMVVVRLPAMKKAGIDINKAVGGKPGALDGVVEDKAQWPAHNYIHLMEQPTLFYAAAMVIALTGTGDGFNATIAWGYVILRIAHSVLQATVNIIRYRFLLFALSTLCLVALSLHALIAVFGCTAEARTMHSEILKPLTLLAAWSMIMWLWMYITRIPALMRNPDYDATGSVGSVGADIRGKVPAAVQWKADNYNHLMEQPTVFYAVAIAMALMGAGDGFNAVLAWIYVAFRVLHSLVQVLVNRVVVRFALHLIGTIPLLMLTAHAAFAAFGHGFGHH